MIRDAEVMLWGRQIGAVSWLPERALAAFQYAPEFLASGIQLSPLVMPLQDTVYEFPALERASFHGLPGLLADSLPDKYGHAIIDAWLAAQGRSPESFQPVERLCFVGQRGMGALEFQPALGETPRGGRELELAGLVELANRVLDERAQLDGRLQGVDDHEAIKDILRVGTSAGGARAKAVLAWNPQTGSFRSGQVPVDGGYQHWILKFDGVSTADPETATPQGYGRIEYAYHLMARAAGIEMSECRLHEEGGRYHFMTRRFDRDTKGNKLHMQSLGALAHFDYRQPFACSYEQVLQVMRRLQLPMRDTEQLVIRAFFNIAGRNCDDHVKNIAFLMDRQGRWRLAPAFDLSYAWNPQGLWTSQHQLSMNGKRRDFSREDLLGFAGLAGIKIPRARRLLDALLDVIQRWPEFARQAGVPEQRITQIGTQHCLLT